MNEPKSPVINKSILEGLAGNEFNDFKLCLLRQVKVPTAGQSLERPGQDVGMQPTQGSGSTDG